MVTITRWDILEELDSEKAITGYLEAAVRDIEEGECDASYILDALASAAKARAVNQLAKEAGMDRRALCSLFSGGVRAGAPELSHEAIARAARAFTEQVPALA